MTLLWPNIIYHVIVYHRYNKMFCVFNFSLTNKLFLLFYLNFLYLEKLEIISNPSIDCLIERLIASWISSAKCEKYIALYLWLWHAQIVCCCKECHWFHGQLRNSKLFSLQYARRQFNTSKKCNRQPVNVIYPWMNNVYDIDYIFLAYIFIISLMLFRNSWIKGRFHKTHHQF